MKGQERGGSNPPFSASNSLDLEPQKALVRGSFCLVVQVFVHLIDKPSCLKSVYLSVRIDLVAIAIPETTSIVMAKNR